MRWTFLAMVFLASCGSNHDCISLKAQAISAIDAHKSCSQDADCVFLENACSLPGECGVAVNVSAAKEVKSLSDQFASECSSEAKMCPGCPLPIGTQGAKCDGTGRCICAAGGCDS